MSIGSGNRTIIKSLIETFQRKLDPAKMYDCLKKIYTDVDKVFTTVFEGPLPSTSINLTRIPWANLDNVPNIAYTDEANIFTENQTIHKDFPTIFAFFAAGVKKLRIKQILTTHAVFSQNLDFTGGAWATDSGDGSALQLNDGNIVFNQMIGGIVYAPVRIDTARLIRWSGAVSTAGASADEHIFPNNVNLRGVNAAGTTTIPMLMLDANNLVALGVGALNTGVGHVKIPVVTSANLPAAGVTRNGIIVIDSTNATICYYVNNLRYRIPIGAAF